MMRLAIAGVVLALSGAEGATAPAPDPRAPQDRRAPELEGGRGWINTDKPVRMADLKGKIVLLDFWTYC